jgi:hypothetical protein
MICCGTYLSIGQHIFLVATKMARYYYYPDPAGCVPLLGDLDPDNLLGFSNLRIRMKYLRIRNTSFQADLIF